MWLASRVFGTVVFVWVVIGALAAWERAYFQKLPTDCAHVATIAGVISAGPLNYLGLNPRLDSCHMQLPRLALGASLRLPLRPRRPPSLDAVYARGPCAVYNRRRRHSSLGMICPVEFENRLTQTAQAAPDPVSTKRGQAQRNAFQHR